MRGYSVTGSQGQRSEGVGRSGRCCYLCGLGPLTYFDSSWGEGTVDIYFIYAGHVPLPPNSSLLDTPGSFFPGDGEILNEGYTPHECPVSRSWMFYRKLEVHHPWCTVVRNKMKQIQNRFITIQQN